MADPAQGSSMLERVGKALLAIDRQNWPELFDEAMECAMMAARMTCEALAPAWFRQNGTR